MHTNIPRRTLFTPKTTGENLGGALTVDFAGPILERPSGKYNV